MPNNKYNIGDEVDVEFIGTVVEIKRTLDGNSLLYTVRRNQDVFANATESMVFPLPTEEEINNPT